MAAWDTYSIFEGKDTCRARLCDTTIGNSWYWHSGVCQSEGCTGPKHHWGQHQHLFHVSLHCWWLVSPHWISSDCLSESALFISNQWSESHSFLQFQISQSDDQCTAAPHYLHWLYTSKSCVFPAIIHNSKFFMKPSSEPIFVRIWLM